MNSSNGVFVSTDPELKGPGPRRSIETVNAGFVWPAISYNPPVAPPRLARPTRSRPEIRRADEGVLVTSGSSASRSQSTTYSTFFVPSLTPSFYLSPPYQSIPASLFLINLTRTC